MSRPRLGTVNAGSPSDTHAVSRPAGTSPSSSARFHASRPVDTQYANNSRDPHHTNATHRVNTSSVSTSDGTELSTGTDYHAGAATNMSLEPYENQLARLSALAAAQHKMSTEASSAGAAQSSAGPATGGAKRMADGEVKALRGSTSPVKGHSRNTSTMSAVSTVSMASTTASTIGDLSSDLKTRLSYAMLKVQNGWQANSLDEVESMASRAASPASSNSTAHRPKDASASPRVPHPSSSENYTTSSTRLNSAYDPTYPSRKSLSPPQRPVGQLGLAPPAPIRPSVSHPNKRRNSTARQPPKLAGIASSHAYSPASQSPAQLSPLVTNPSHLRSRDAAVYSPHQNVREQDAIETLLFMSSPGNSANMKHSFSPAASPGPALTPAGSSKSNAAAAAAAARHALPAGPRKALPSQRPAFPEKKVGFANSPLTSQPQSPMDLDSPQQSHYQASPNRSQQARRRVNGATSHLRGALSLPSGLGATTPSVGGMGAKGGRRTIDDAYVERMLERAAAESSDEGEIELPPRRAAGTTA